MTRPSCERIEEIREWTQTVLHNGVQANLFELLAEIDALEAENRLLKNDSHYRRAKFVEQERDCLKERVANLRVHLNTIAMMHYSTAGILAKEALAADDEEAKG